MPARLIIPHLLVEEMRAHVQRCLPEEGCGILGGSARLVKVVLPVTNDLHSPVRFNMAPEELFKAFVWLEENSMEMLAYYHSHPRGPAHLSPTDLLYFSYPGVALVLLSQEYSNWVIKGFIINKNTVEEIPIEPIHRSK